MLTFKHKGDFKNTERFFNATAKGVYFQLLDKYGQMGVTALAQATPKDSGETANSWTYDVVHSKNKSTIAWNNSHVTSEGTPIAIILQYGHGTGTGGFVQGRDYINPAIRPLFDKMADDVWKAVISL
jgi:hypothetical protein